MADGAPELDKVTAVDFEPHVGATCPVRAGDQEVPLVLVGVRRLGTSTTEVRGEAFALDFHGPAEPVLAGQTWAITIADLGCLELFVSPVAQRVDGGIAYEAIFN